MDEICVWYQKLARWLARGALPPIPFIGTAGSRYLNPPAPHLEMVLVLEGEYNDLRVGDQLCRLPCEHISLHSVHFGNYSSVPAQKTKVWCMFLDVGGVPEFESLNKKPLFCCMPVANIRQLSLAFERIAAACRLPGAPTASYPRGPLAYDPRRETAVGSAPFHLQSALLSLLALLIDQASRLAHGGPQLESASVQKAIEHIGRHYAEPELALPEIAHAANTSIDHFGRVFRQATGTTPMRYLKTLRVRQSCYLLEHTGLRVREIAREVGFEDAYHFSRVFTQEMGRSPRAYRER